MATQTGRKIESIRALQQIAFEGLKVLKNVCEKHELTYMLCYGTLLGAVRHQGFIPWDDDIDIMMPRSDFEKLKKLEASEFGEDWRLYSYDTIPGYYQAFMKLCYTKTEKRPSPFESGLTYGISVDIFPCDNLPAASDTEASEKAAALRRYKAHYDKLLHPIVSKRKGRFGKLIRQVLHIQHLIMKPFLSVKKAYQRIEKKWISEDEASRYVLICEDIYKQVWQRKDIFAEDGRLPQLCFEGCWFNVPLNYDKMLRSLYHNYMELPPVEKRISGHTFEAYYLD